jgi:hypothetical protein
MVDDIDLYCFLRVACHTEDVAVVVVVVVVVVFVVDHDESVYE